MSKLMNSFFCFSFLFFSLVANENISASSSLGRDGEPFEIEGVKWQDYHIQSGDFLVSATLPGSPSSKIINNLLVGSSTYQGLTYELKVYSSQYYDYSLEKNEVIKYFSEPFIILSEIQTDQASILYAFQAQVFNKDLTSQNAVCQIFITEEAMIIARVDGVATPLTEYFFNSIRLK